MLIWLSPTGVGFGVIYYFSSSLSLLIFGQRTWKEHVCNLLKGGGEH